MKTCETSSERKSRGFLLENCPGDLVAEISFSFETRPRTREPLSFSVKCSMPLFVINNDKIRHASPPSRGFMMHSLCGHSFRTFTSGRFIREIGFFESDCDSGINLAQVDIQHGVKKGLKSRKMDDDVFGARWRHSGVNQGA
ncbi:MAG: hypothetical protein ACP5SH_01600 [Syntrophobacteraceae bacterium]